MNEAQKLISSFKEVPAMPNVVIKALNIVRDPDSSIRSLGEMIAYDQSISIKVLNLVNSAYYGFAQQITSLTRALTLLGLMKAKNIIITVAMKPMFAKPENKELWKHSITVAVGCELLAEHLKLMDKEEAFVIGFMHDIGKIVLNIKEPLRIKKVNDLTSRGADVIEAERMYFNTDHSEIGAALSKQWQLPILLTNTIRYHHNPSVSSIPAECTLVYLVDKIVQENFTPEVLNTNYINNLNIKLSQPMILRESILNKANMLISELSN